MNLRHVAVLAAFALVAGCASRGGSTSSSSAAPAASPAPAAASDNGGYRAVKSRDGSFDGEMYGTPAPGSRFSKVAIGMEYEEVTRLIGAPSNMHVHETGKRWIPFYYGNDVTRMEVDYPGEGCLSFTGGNHWGGGGHQLIRITADPSGAKCKE